MDAYITISIFSAFLCMGGCTPPCPSYREVCRVSDEDFVDCFDATGCFKLDGWIIGGKVRVGCHALPVLTNQHVDVLVDCKESGEKKETGGEETGPVGQPPVGPVRPPARPLGPPPPAIPETGVVREENGGVRPGRPTPPPPAEGKISANLVEMLGIFLGALVTGIISYLLTRLVRHLKRRGSTTTRGILREMGVQTPRSTTTMMETTF